MDAIIKRSFYVAMGQSPPPELAYVISDHRGHRIVTWAEVMDARRTQQRTRLARKRQGVERRIYKLWVAYFDTWIFRGWQAFLSNPLVPPFHRSTWIDRDRWGVREPLMTAFPLVLPLGTEKEQWEMWKPAFANTYARRLQDGRALGVQFVWWDQHLEVIPVTSKKKT